MLNKRMNTNKNHQSKPSTCSLHAYLQELNKKGSGKARNLEIKGGQKEQVVSSQIQTLKKKQN